MIRILIIEDEIIIARFIERQLQANFSCETRIAISAAEAQTAMEEMLPHLLLCDIHLEDALTGIDLVIGLRRRYAFEVIYITSYQTRGIIEKAATTHPANYIIKPIDESQLLPISALLATGGVGEALIVAMNSSMFASATARPSST